MKSSFVLATLVALAGIANADDKTDAEALFQQGKQLMDEKRYADACAAFEQSNKLDVAIGTQLNIAKCYEEWGKLGSAYLAYQAAEKMANDAQDPRAPKINELVVALEPSVPHLTIRAPAGAPADLEVMLDGSPVVVLGDPIVVDPGPHTIEWSIGGAKKTKTVSIDPGGDSEVSLDATPSVAERATPALATVTPRPPGYTQRLGGLALGGLGIVAVGVSSYLTLSAHGDYNDALDMHCGGMKDSCDMTGLELTRDARSRANTATFVFFAGAAMVGGGVALYLLAPKAATADEPAQPQSVYVTPAISRDGIGVVLGGRM